MGKCWLDRIPLYYTKIDTYIKPLHQRLLDQIKLFKLEGFSRFKANLYITFYITVYADSVILILR